MLTLTARTRVAELQAGPPALMETLRSTGLFRDGDDPNLMLGELCWSFGFNPGILLMMLQSANVPEEVPPVDPAPFEALPLAELVDHIEQTHHVYLRRELPRLVALAGQLAGAAPGFADLQEEVAALDAELHQHLLHEEESLFPMVRELAAGTAVSPTRCGGSVGGPISCMENEHDLTVRALGRMRELTGDYAAPAGADATVADLMATLAAVDRDLREHIFKENKVLFPRALATQRGQRTTATA